MRLTSLRSVSVTIGCGFFPATRVNDEYRMTLDEFLERFEYLAEAVEAVDDTARKVFTLALFA